MEVSDLTQLNTAEALQEMVVVRLGERQFTDPAVQKLAQQARRYAVAAGNILNDAIKKEAARGS